MALKAYSYVPKKPLTLASIKEVYKCWLSGQSLRTLGKEIGCSHNTVATRLRAKYGDKATNLVARSFERALVCDYGIELLDYAYQLAVTWPNGHNPEKGKHRSQHNLKQLSRFQSSGRDEIIERVATLDPMLHNSDYSGKYGLGLRLPLFRVLTAQVTDALRVA